VQSEQLLADSDGFASRCFCFQTSHLFSEEAYRALRNLWKKLLCALHQKCIERTSAKQ
jgi:hypothetical protein